MKDFDRSAPGRSRTRVPLDLFDERLGKRVVRASQITPYAVRCLAPLAARTLATVIVGMARNVSAGPNRIAAPTTPRATTIGWSFTAPPRTMGLVDDVLDQLGEHHGHDYPDNERVDGHERQDRMDVLGQQRVSQPAEQRGGKPHVRHHVAGTREDADGNRPSQRDANAAAMVFLLGTVSVTNSRSTGVAQAPAFVRRTCNGAARSGMYTANLERCVA